VPSKAGNQIPLAQLAKIKYVRGRWKSRARTRSSELRPLDMKPGHGEVDVVEHAASYLRFKIDSGELKLPAGVSYAFTGNYENHVRAEKKLKLIFPSCFS